MRNSVVLILSGLWVIWDFISAMSLDGASLIAYKLLIPAFDAIV